MKKSKFLLFDNDEYRVGKVHHGKKVNKPATEFCDHFDHLIIVPYAYSSLIKEQWLDLGFKGKISTTVSNG